MSVKYLQMSVRLLLLLALSIFILGNAAAQTQVPKLGIDKSLLAFGRVQVGSSPYLTFKISNDGNDDIMIDSIKTAGRAFSISPSSFPLSSGSSQTVTVSFSPSRYGNIRDTLKIYSKDTTVVINITGIGVKTQGPYLTVWQKKVSFGDQKAGTAVTKKIIVSNFGVEPLVISPFTFTGNTDNAFTAGMTSAAAIADCDSAECEITFAPKTEKDYSAVLNFNSNSYLSQGESIVQLQLEGRGIKNTAGPSAGFSKNLIDFGELLLDQSLSQDLIITNTGTADLIITSVTSDNGSFTTDFQNLTITPGAGKPLSVKFQPGSIGTFNGILTIYYNSPESPAQVALTGKCVKVNTNFTVTTEILFENINDIRNYRIIGLPGKIDLPAGQVLKGRSGYDWNAVWDNGQDSGYKIKYDGTSMFNFRPGNAFWILSREPLKVAVWAESVPLNSNNIYSIPLHKGWNLISNPFDITVSWEKIKQRNFLHPNSVIYSWNGAYAQSPLFVPYQGYYFYNSYQMDSLQIPYTLLTASETVQSIKKQENPSRLKITLLDEGRELSSAAMGLDKNASADFDTLDYFAPPGDFESAGISLYNGSITPGYKYLSCEMRSDESSGEIFSLRLKNELNKNLQLLAEGAGSFNSNEVFLIEKETGRFTDLRRESVINISSFHKNREYSVAVGNPEFVNALKKSMVPSEFKVNQNYPNPFNPSTSVLYSIPSDSRVEISIYNMLGERIEQLKNALETAGTYEVNWDASHYAAGVYFCAVTATPSSGSKTNSAVRKMLLLK